MKAKRGLVLAGLLTAFGTPFAGTLEELKNLLSTEGVEINLALTADYLYTANRDDSNGTVKVEPDKFGFNSFLGIFKTASESDPLGFGLAVSNNAWAPVVGIEPMPDADNQYTVDQAYVELMLGKVSVLAGRILTNIGGEAPYTWQNVNIQRGLVWNGEPVFYNGFRISFDAAPFGFYFGVNDRDTADGKFAVEAGISGSWSELKTDWSFNVLYPDKADENNARVFNLTTNFGGLEFAPITFYADYLNVPTDQGDRNAWGFALLTDLTITEKTSMGFRVERVIQEDGVDAYGIGCGNDAWTVTLTPKYAFNRYLYLRAEASYVSLDDPAFVKKYYPDGTAAYDDSEWRFGAEVGFVF
ncbi:MAG: outer membrane beta-barrel protein [Aquificae bacterium]|nr:outer membrane beta-barrel protein [Aquificota bacterium]